MQEWLLKSDLSAGAKLTYSVLACCAGGRDYAWPSQEFLAENVSVSVRTLQRYLAELVRVRLIEKAKKYIKGQVRNIYRFLVHSVIGLPKAETQNVVATEQNSNQVDHNIQCSDRHDNLSLRPELDSIGPPAVAQIGKNLPTDTTNCTERHDNLSPSCRPLLIRKKLIAVRLICDKRVQNLDELCYEEIAITHSTQGDFGLGSS